MQIEPAVGGGNGKPRPGDVVMPAFRSRPPQSGHERGAGLWGMAYEEI
jgi:hypothetical protein